MVKRRVPPAGFIEPCIPILAHKSPSGPQWVHEIKHDGYRLLVRRDGERLRLFTRRGYDWTERFPAISAAAAKLRAKSFTLDGEAVICGPDGIAAFDELHGRRRLSEAILYAFDLLELNGEDFRPFPFSKRKARLARLLAQASAGLALNEHLQAVKPRCGGVCAVRPRIGTRSCQGQEVTSNRVKAPAGSLNSKLYDAPFLTCVCRVAQTFLRVAASDSSISARSLGIVEL